jgi:hypothetical protein
MSCQGLESIPLIVIDRFLINFDSKIRFYKKRNLPQHENIGGAVILIFNDFNGKSKVF